MRNQSISRSPLAALLLCGLTFVVDAELAYAQTPAFVAPPRTIADITAILDQEKPDPARLAKNQAAADANPPTGAGAAALWKFYFDRGRIRAELGRIRDAIADMEQAIRVGTAARDILRARQFLAQQLKTSGETKMVLEQLAIAARLANQPGLKGRLFSIYRHTAEALIFVGDLEQAETYVRRTQTLLREARAWPQYSLYGSIWEAEIERSRARLADAKGQFREAEAAYRRSEVLMRDALTKLPKWDFPPPRSELETRIDFEIALQGRAKANQGHLAEAEALIRRALLSRLRGNGKYAPPTATQITELASVLREQGRYAEAEKLARIALDIRKTIAVHQHSRNIAESLDQVSFLLKLQQRDQEAAETDAELDKVISNWDPRQRQAYELNSSRVHTLYASGQTEAGIKAARTLLARETERFGEKHFNTALGRGFLAIGLARLGRQVEAVAEFKASVPTLLAAPRGNADDSVVVALRDARVRDVIETYVAVLASAQGGDDTAGQAFRLADTVRSRSVQHALTSSSARLVAKDGELAKLARLDQDLEKQINAQLGILNNLLALPSGERDDKVIRQINADLDKARAARTTARAEIVRRFPSYAELIDPRPPTVDEVRAALRPGEALLSFYFGRDVSFVWAVTKDRPIAFVAIAATAADIESRIAKLRRALEPDAATIGAIPPFDLSLASDLYEQLLKPVEAAWKPAKSLVVVTNSALGLLPLGLLPTQRTTVNDSVEPAFSAYREVAWLARTHAVTLVPSAAAFKTLRQLPASLARREPLIGFGDPYFNERQAVDAEREEAALQVASQTQAPVRVAELTMAGSGMALRRRASSGTEIMDSAELGRLPRLTDTADELKAVAHALGVDPSTTLRLGKAANEQAVKGADLSRYRIVAFATHGLLPGDLNGLTQPALALTAPQVAGVDGDGLLTMEEVLTLKLDADWVVLSACNTGAGTASGAEAVSGLGRAFFYAGTRALLLANWSVHSASARDLVSDLFRRHAADPKLPRGEALRQAMMALVDGGAYTEGGKTLYAYAHPLFWAPYSIIGEGG